MMLDIPVVDEVNEHYALVSHHVCDNVLSDVYIGCSTYFKKEFSTTGYNHTLEDINQIAKCYKNPSYMMLDIPVVGWSV